MKKNKTSFVFPDFFRRENSILLCHRWLLVIVISLGFSFGAFAQQQKVSINVKNVDVSVVFRQIKEQTKLNFVYDPDQLASIANVTMNEKNVSVDSVLSKLFTGTSFEYRFEMNAILIKKKEVKKQVGEITVSGVVKDVKGDLLPGVTIMVKGTALGTSTDIHGAYQLTVAKGESLELVFSFVGMESQEVKYTGQKTIDVVLKETVESMDEVVVTGIFTRKKEGFTGSANRVSGSELKKMSSGNVLRALQLLDPGFKMSTSNISGSNPQAVPDFEMRGRSNMGDYQSDDVVVLRGDYNTRPNQPLFVLDGIIGVDVTTIMDLDPEQIEAITLLKDAAATVIYGSEAANGVVIVETKAPATGKLRVTYNGNYKLQVPDLRDYDLCDARDKILVEELAGFYDDKNNASLNEYYNTIKYEVARGVNTYWLSKPLRTVFNHRHGLSLEGGDYALRYKLYFGYNAVPGVMKESDLTTKTGKIDLRYRFGKFLISNQLQLDYTTGRRTSPYGDFSEYTLLNPYYRTHGEDGKLLKELGDFGSFRGPIGNPLYNTTFETRDDLKELKIMEAFKLEYLPKDNLRLSLDFSLERNDGTVEVFKPSMHTDFLTESDPGRKGSYAWTKSDGYNYRLSVSGAWNKSWNKHLFAVFGRYTLTESRTNMSTFNMTGFPSDKLSEVYLGMQFKNVTGDESVSRSMGAVFTLNYSFDQRYAVDYSMRIDASSQFGKNNRYAPFWSVGGRWNMDKEKFVQNWGLFDEMVLRASYGITGSQGFSSYQALQMYTYAGLTDYYKSSDVIGAELLGLGNPDLKWQQTDNYNVALDFSMWDALLSVRAEYYEKYTKNTLLDYTISPSTGFDNMKENLGRISNKGYEVTLRLMPYRNVEKEAYWNVSLTAGHNESKIEEVSNALKAQNEITMNKVEGRPLPRYESGYSQTMIWAVRSMGIDPATGREVFLMRNGETTNEWKAEEQVPVGDTEPKLSGSLSTSFNYMGFSLNVAASYRIGGDVYNYTLVDKIENADLHQNVDRRALKGRWREPGDVVPYKAFDPDDYGVGTKASSRFVMKDNELVVSSINLSYQFSPNRNQFLKKWGISSASLGVYVEDVFRKSTVKMERGIAYPFAQSVSMSLNVTF